MAGATAVTVTIDVSCAVCTEVCMDIVETVCGHLFCSECLTQAVQRKPNCPVCRAPIKDQRPRPAAFLRRAIKQQIIGCPNAHASSGCAWRGNKKDVADHTCLCSACTEPIWCAEMEHHLALTCPERRVTCQNLGCQFSVRATEDKPPHIESCPFVKITCTRCGRKTTRSEVHTHNCDIGDFDRPIVNPIYRMYDTGWRLTMTAGDRVDVLLYGEDVWWQAVVTHTDKCLHVKIHCIGCGTDESLTLLYRHLQPPGSRRGTRPLISRCADCPWCATCYDADSKQPPLDVIVTPI